MTHSSFTPMLLARLTVLAVAMTHATGVSALTRIEAEQRAISGNPLFAASAAAVDAADGDVRQAALLINPEVSYSRENLGNGKLTGLDGPTSTWLLSQRLELAGQRGARREGALGEADFAGARLQRERSVLLADVRATWAEVLIAQQRVTYAEQLGQVARRNRDAVFAQVTAGKVSPVAVTRLDVATAALQRREQAAKVSLQLARQKLAGLQGLQMPDFGPLTDSLPPIEPLPANDRIAQSLQANPLIKEASAKTRARQAGLRSARAGRFPDVTVSVGQTQFEKAGESALQLGVSLPLPLFNRNQGATQAAEARLREAQAQALSVSQNLYATVDALYRQTQSLTEQLAAFEASVLPASEQAFNAISKGYGFGKFGLLDVLDAQRALIDTRFEYLDTLTEYYRQRYQLDALLALAQENLP